jgi:hypothetical protein
MNNIQQLTIEQQCEAFMYISWHASLSLNPDALGDNACVKIFSGEKAYYFSDPDPDIIIRQMSELWRNATSISKSS